MLLWIQDAPVIGVDDADKVLAWIEDRITCKLPDKESDPELHAMVTKYQLHKCSGYCKRKIKHGGVFVTTCKSNFPRTPQEKTVFHSCITIAFKKRWNILLSNSQMYFRNIPIEVPITSGHVLQGNNVNYTKIHVWVPWSASSVLAKKIELTL